MRAGRRVSLEGMPEEPDRLGRFWPRVCGNDIALSTELCAFHLSLELIVLENDAYRF